MATEAPTMLGSYLMRLRDPSTRTRTALTTLGIALIAGGAIYAASRHADRRYRSGFSDGFREGRAHEDAEVEA